MLLVGLQGAGAYGRHVPRRGSDPGELRGSARAEGMTPLQLTKERRISGLPISDGLAHARVYILRRDRSGVPVYTLQDSSEAAGEKARLAEALDETARRLEKVVEDVTGRLGTIHASIFSAQMMMVQDPELLARIHALIDEERRNAESAVEKAFFEYESLLRDAEDEYLRERATDIAEVRRRIIDLLCSAHPVRDGFVPDHHLHFTERTIVVAEELTPFETIMLDTEHTAGFITERGGRASHAAILARGLGIPAVSGVKNVLHHFEDGQDVLINGASGDIIIRPAPRTLELYPGSRRASAPEFHVVAPASSLEVMANINLAAEVDAAVAMRAEGIGLYRTEFEFFSAGRLLNEDEQYARYRYVVQAMSGRPVYIRLLDVGGDKPAHFLELEREENPCLGFRGARLLLGRTDLLIPQARALARASIHGPIHLMYPMVVDLNQFLVMRELVRQQTSDITGAQLRHGVMLEVPSACLDAEQILEAAEFASIGSNDLIQYLFAVDRNNDKVAYDFQPDRPAFWRLLGEISAAASRKQRPLALCGEVGGQPQHLPKLMDLGIRSVSVSPRLIGLARTAATQADRLRNR